MPTLDQFRSLPIGQDVAMPQSTLLGSQLCPPYVFLLSATGEDVPGEAGTSGMRLQRGPGLSPSRRESLFSDPVREVSGAWYSEQPRSGFGPGTEWQTRRNTFQEGKEACQHEGGPARRACWAPGAPWLCGGQARRRMDSGFSGLSLQRLNHLLPSHFQ